MEAKVLTESPDEIPSFYIQATESIQERWPRTLKHGDSFALFDALGDFVNPGTSPGGLFYFDTRHLSGLELLIDGQPARKLKSGEGFIVPAGAKHDARNIGSQPLKLVAVYVVEKGKPLATPAP